MFLLLIACGENEFSSDPSQDPFKNHLINTFPGIDGNSAIHPGTGLIYQASWLILPEDDGKLIIYDQADFTIKLLNSDGELLSTAGRRGRGPGEFGDYARVWATVFMSNTFAERTLWDMDGEWFYYLSTHSSEITRFHLDTGMLEIISLISLPEREQNTETIHFFKEKYGSNDENTDPEQFFSVLFDNQLMPMFLSFRVQDHILLLQTL